MDGLAASQPAGHSGCTQVGRLHSGAAGLTPQVKREHSVAAVGEAAAQGCPHLGRLPQVVQQQDDVPPAAPLQVPQAQA
jgi:hypothetical protein